MTMQAVPTGSNGTSAQFTPVGDIPQLVSDLREVFDSGRTRPVEWRLRQLDGLRKMLIERESDIAGALAQDLGKPGLEAYIAEIGHARAELDYIAKRLKKWAKPQKVGSPIVVQPGKSYRYSDPLGLVLIIAPWNYPFSLAIDPLVGALAAGNCVVVKPSEVAEATSTLIAKLLPEYIDAEATKVVEAASLLGCNSASLEINAKDTDEAMELVATRIRRVLERADRLEIMVLIRPTKGLTQDAERLYRLIERHGHYTNSEKAKTILADWSTWAPKFKKVMPVEYRRALAEMAKHQAADQTGLGVIEVGLQHVKGK